MIPEDRWEALYEDTMRSKDMIRHRYYCKKCWAKLEKYLNHVMCADLGDRCEGTWKHPRNGCTWSDEDVGHGLTVLKVTNE